MPAPDLAKRKRVMQRSIRLGHCICDPKKPCPCDVFKLHDVCQCAGERLPAADRPVRLSEMVEYAGCASKIDQASLKRILSGLPQSADPNLLIGMAAGDDAGVYKLSGDLALVQTVDVFTPSVDDAYTFGQIAAANSVSDVYAMGGTPLTALSIVGFPLGEASDSVLADILRGGIDKMSEAGVAVVGGHSIKDHEVKAGFAVTGLVKPSEVFTNAAARPGDSLVLTKPLGTGIIAFAGQINRASAESLSAAAASMTMLNKTASELLREFHAHAVTDVTGFGLMGHLGEMASASGVAVEIIWDDLPLLPGVLDLLSQGVIPGGVERNRESSAHHAAPGPGVTDAMLDICYDPQTSGGLLVSLPADSAAGYIARLAASGIAASAIGSVKSAGAPRVSVITTARRRLDPAPRAPAAGTPVCGTGGPPRRVNLLSTSVEPHRSTSDSLDSSQRAAAESKPNGNSVTGSGQPPAASAGTPSQPVSVHEFKSDEREPHMPSTDEPCCSPDAFAAAAPGAASDAAARFQDFMRAVSTPGALDVHTKEALALALSIATRCGPCTKAHLKKARAMGFSDAEIDELAWMAVFFGGSPVMMFYNDLK